MLTFSLTVYMLAAPVLFDMNALVGLFFPGREVVEIASSDGETMRYACKPGAAGETPQEQAARAQAAFETNLEKFAVAWTDDMMESVNEGENDVSQALTLTLKINGWAAAITTHLEREYGCALID